MLSYLLLCIYMFLMFHSMYARSHRVYTTVATGTETLLPGREVSSADLIFRSVFRFCIEERDVGPGRLAVKCKHMRGVS